MRDFNGGYQGTSMVGYSGKLKRWGGYVFDESSIQELATRVQKFTEVEPDLEASLRGGHELKSQKVEELLADAFLRNNQI
jgi:hypothetical protein